MMPDHADVSANPVRALRELVDAATPPTIRLYAKPNVARYSDKTRYHRNERCSDVRKVQHIMIPEEFARRADMILCKRCATTSKFPASEAAEIYAAIVYAAAAMTLSNYSTGTHSTGDPRRILAYGERWRQQARQGDHPWKALIEAASPDRNVIPDAEPVDGLSLLEIGATTAAVASYAPSNHQVKVIAGTQNTKMFGNSADRFRRKLHETVTAGRTPQQAVAMILDGFPTPGDASFDMLGEEFTTERASHNSTRDWLTHEYGVYRRAVIDSIIAGYDTYRDSLIEQHTRQHVWLVDGYWSALNAVKDVCDKHPNRIEISMAGNRGFILADMLELLGAATADDASRNNVIRQEFDWLTTPDALQRKLRGLVRLDQVEGVDADDAACLSESPAARQIALSLWLNDDMKLEEAVAAAALTVAPVPV